MISSKRRALHSVALECSPWYMKPRRSTPTFLRAWLNHSEGFYLGLNCAVKESRRSWLAKPDADTKTYPSSFKQRASWETGLGGSSCHIRHWESVCVCVAGLPALSAGVITEVRWRLRRRRRRRSRRRSLNGHKDGREKLRNSFVASLRVHSGKKGKGC